jgi:hypothetical protein
MPFITDRTILANRPDVVLRVKKENSCLLIDIDVTNNSNFNTRDTEKLRKCKNLEIEVSRMWEMRTKIVPFVIVGSGTIKKELDKNLQLFPAHLLATELQKVTLMGTAHIILQVLGKSL